MILLAFRKIIDNKSRTILTILGIVIAIVDMVAGMYYLYIGNRVSYEQLATVTEEQRLLYDEVSIFNTVYYENGDEMEGFSQPINDTYIKKIANMKHVTGVVENVEVEKLFKLDFEKYKFEIETLSGINTIYDTFSNALIKVADIDKPVIYGKDFDQNNKYEALINEVSLKYMGIQAKDIVGKKVRVTDENGKFIDVDIVGVYAYELSSYYDYDIEEIGLYRESENYDIYGMDILFSKGVIDYFESSSYQVRTVKVSVDNVSNVEIILEDVKNNTSYEYLSDYEMYYKTIRSTLSYNRLVFLIGVFILIVAILLIISTVVLNISDQKATINVFWCLGIKRTEICSYFIWQGIWFCVVGSILGGVVGYVITLILGCRFATQYNQLIKRGLFILPFYYVLALIGIVLFICMMIGILVKAIFLLLRVREKNR